MTVELIHCVLIAIAVGVIVFVALPINIIGVGASPLRTLDTRTLQLGTIEIAGLLS